MSRFALQIGLKQQLMKDKGCALKYTCQNQRVLRSSIYIKSALNSREDCKELTNLLF